MKCFGNIKNACRISPTGDVLSALQRLVFGYVYLIYSGIAVQDKIGLRQKTRNIIIIA